MKLVAALLDLPEVVTRGEGPAEPEGDRDDTQLSAHFRPVPNRRYGD